MKTCPICNARCFDDMALCYSCMHDFSMAISSLPLQGSNGDQAETAVPDAAVQAAEAKLPQSALSEEPAEHDEAALDVLTEALGLDEPGMDGDFDLDEAQLPESERQDPTHILIPLASASAGASHAASSALVSMRERGAGSLPRIEPAASSSQTVLFEVPLGCHVMLSFAGQSA